MAAYIYRVHHTASDEPAVMDRVRPRLTVFVSETCTCRCWLKRLVRNPRCWGWQGQNLEVMGKPNAGRAKNIRNKTRQSRSPQLSRLDVQGASLQSESRYRVLHSRRSRTDMSPDKVAPQTRTQFSHRSDNIESRTRNATQRMHGSWTVLLDVNQRKRERESTSAKSRRHVGSGLDSHTQAGLASRARMRVKPEVTSAEAGWK